MNTKTLRQVAVKTAVGYHQATEPQCLQGTQQPPQDWCEQPPLHQTSEGHQAEALLEVS